MGSLLYFDPFNGASGDMILGALVDLGLPVGELTDGLNRLSVDPFELESQPISRQGMTGTNLKVKCSTQDSSKHRHLSHIRDLILESPLDEWVQNTSLRIFERLGAAEARVHGTSLEKVHFHEVGALDSILDIVGACIGFRYFQVDSFFTSPLSLGQGTVTFSHGTWPVPAPATAELLKELPSRLGPVSGELTTPTGAAIIAELVNPGDVPPVAEFYASGYGAGDREFEEIPNMLRIMLGRAPRATQNNETWAIPEEEVIVLQASIDNLDGEALGYFVERALSEGALDVYYSALAMKKSRPGVELNMLCRPRDRDRLAALVFRETTTLGLRWSSCRRWVLDRESRSLDTDWGTVRVKISRLGGRIVGMRPEFEDLRRIAGERQLPLREVREKIDALLRAEDYE